MKVILTVVGLLLSYASGFIPNFHSSKSVSFQRIPHFHESLAMMADSSRDSSPSQTAEKSISLLQQIYSLARLRQTKQLFAWVSFAALLYCLQSFFPIIIGTFFLSHMGSGIIDSVNARFRKLPRKLFSAAYIVIVTALLIYSVVTVSPVIMKEAQYYLSIVQSNNPYMQVSNLITTTFGGEVSRRLESLLTYILVSSGMLKGGSWEGLNLEKLLRITIQSYTDSAFSFVSKLLHGSRNILYNLLLSGITVRKPPFSSLNCSSIAM